jgi:adenylylsulfate kinase-like enzyme
MRRDEIDAAGFDRSDRIGARSKVPSFARVYVSDEGQLVIGPFGSPHLTDRVVVEHEH